ncbi:hypothetical protein SELMODRAFT_402883 [Selaginella moellendorffii]|uniref:Novel STAND NTPase 1 domain-containing protein n=1 Tax=Selaginella moellendorffii TaxID=88036 RepID=D8QNC4_SELML|nr:hypothetical protein SELMODRAFT_402883 [Selaginella moellendorffii]
MQRRPVKRLRCVCGSDGGEYDLAKAVKAHEAIAAIDKSKLCTAGEITVIPYPGIGKAPSMPGGDLQFVGRRDLESLVEAAKETKTLLVVGPCGIGKSCLLRALACGWIHDAAGTNSRIVCLWDLAIAIAKQDLAGCVKNALRFTFCKEAELLDEIDRLGSMQDIAKFFRDRVAAAGDEFYFVVDQWEMLDAVGEEMPVPVPAKELRKKFHSDLFALFSLAAVTVLGLSRGVGMTQEYLQLRYSPCELLLLEDGFYGEELTAFRDKLSVLGLLCSRFPERSMLVEHYTGRHPFSLAVLDSSCRSYALGKPVARELPSSWLHRRGPERKLSPEEVVACLEDEEDWLAAIETFLSSGEMARIRFSLEYALAMRRPLQRACQTIEDMAKFDSSFIVGNGEEGSEFVTEHIALVYADVFRTAVHATPDPA